MSILPFLVAAWLFVIGAYGIVTSRHLVHLILCLSVCQASTYILLLGVGYREGAPPPLFKTTPVGTEVVDPVVQALTLTDVVVQATVTALLLALTVQAARRYGTVDPDELGAMHD